MTKEGINIDLLGLRLRLRLLLSFLYRKVGETSLRLFLHTVAAVYTLADSSKRFKYAAN